MPRISNRLARIEPRIEACTIRISFFARAMMKMMSSTALPKETLSKEAQVSPSLLATASVACASSPASGMMATAFMAKTTVGLAVPGIGAQLMPIPMGTNISRTLIQLWQTAFLVWLRKRQEPALARAGHDALATVPMVADSWPCSFVWDSSGLEAEDDDEVVAARAEAL